MTTSSRLRRVIDAVHGSKWARIIPIALMGVIYLISMITWHPTEPMAWVFPLLLDASLAGGMYFINRFSSGTVRFNDFSVLFFSFCAVSATMMTICGLTEMLRQGFNPGLGAGPSMFLGISLYHRYRMKKGI